MNGTIFVNAPDAHCGFRTNRESKKRRLREKKKDFSAKERRERKEGEELQQSRDSGGDALPGRGRAKRFEL